MQTQISKFFVKTENRTNFKAALLRKKQVADSDQDYTEMRLFQDDEDPNIIFVYERMLDDATLKTHQKTDVSVAVAQMVETAMTAEPDIISLRDTFPEPDHTKHPNPEDDVSAVFFIFKLHEEFHVRVVERFETHLKLTREEQGCILLDLYTVRDDKSRLAVYELWRQKSDLTDIHFNLEFAKETGALLNEAVVGNLGQYMNFVTEFSEV